ncbi:EAL domain-containing protein [uncultured Cohaesibacter sp.]|uniref:putative bifunctional diguanylate cyclase/phosphodiesterase n=1 Tax=uncultured Cohaesibacter sp. TaxID=1002546 RepID=UPI0029C8D4AC|nr:EAL domain-containing protein [uncultured Cohaesibacter sp.]
MLTVLSCIYTEHDLLLVALAALLCIIGSLVTLRLVRHAVESEFGHHFGWFFLAAVSGGGSVWATHFVAMLAYKPKAAVSFDPALTILSLVIAIAGLLGSFCLSGFRQSPIRTVIGGAFVGLTFATMHYTGMFAYRIVGLLTWDMGLIWASILISVALSMFFSTLIWKPAIGKLRFLSAVMTMVLSIVGLHFTGMAAFTVTPMTTSFPDIDASAMISLAMAIALVTLIILGAGLTSHLIDSRVRSHSREELHHLTSHDVLTGIPNREGFKRYVNSAIESAEHYGVKVAILGIDLNRFKEINDRLGHAAGDFTLHTLAGRMKTILREDEFVARIGGDEFAAVKFFHEKSTIASFAERLAFEIAQPIDIDGVRNEVGASLGAAIWPDDGETSSELVNNANLAMYHAKCSFMSKLCFYDAEIGADMRKKRKMADDLRRALDNDELQLHYQVQKSMGPERDIHGFEALLRWTHPDLGPISPALFIPVAEENGLISALGLWVLKRACVDAASWDPPYRVAVNVSAVQFMDPHLPQYVEDVLALTGLNPSRLELELTETALVKDTARSLDIMLQVKALGVGIALDDFGTGYSSLEILRTFPFDKIKLDKSFVDDINKDRSSLAIVRAVLALGKSLSIPVLAEGIETEEQMAILRDEGCDEGQGYLLGRPSSLESLLDTGSLDKLVASERATTAGTRHPVTTDDALAPLLARAG